MAYQCILPNSVKKQIQKLPPDVKSQILQRLKDLQNNPRLSGYIKMKNSAGYRIRIGDYRIIYDINEDTKTINLRKIEHRREIYKL